MTVNGKMVAASEGGRTVGRVELFREDPCTYLDVMCNLSLGWSSSVNIHNYNTRRTAELHISRTKHEFANKLLKYNLPHVINNIPDLLYIQDSDS